MFWWKILLLAAFATKADHISTFAIEAESIAGNCVQESYWLDTCADISTQDCVDNELIKTNCECSCKVLDKIINNIDDKEVKKIQTQLILDALDDASSLISTGVICKDVEVIGLESNGTIKMSTCGEISSFQMKQFGRCEKKLQFECPVSCNSCNITIPKQNTCMDQSILPSKSGILISQSCMELVEDVLEFESKCPLNLNHYCPKSCKTCDETNEAEEANLDDNEIDVCSQVGIIAKINGKKEITTCNIAVDNSGYCTPAIRAQCSTCECCLEEDDEVSVSDCPGFPIWSIISILTICVVMGMFCYHFRGIEHAEQLFKKLNQRNEGEGTYEHLENEPGCCRPEDHVKMNKIFKNISSQNQIGEI